MKLRSVELVLPRAEEAAAFLSDIWGMARASSDDQTHYLRGAGAFPYLVALTEGPEPYVRSTTFVCSREELVALRDRASAAGALMAPTVSTDPGGGEGFLVELLEGETFRFLTDSAPVDPMPGRDLPVKLTHVVLNASDAEAASGFAERALGFCISDRTKGMIFVRCNESHHSTAFARAGFTSLNHIAFEMVDMDAVFRGIGRLRDHDFAPAWGPGRHGPGANVFAYFVAPFGAVIEFSTAVENVPDDYVVGSPDDWTWPERRIDHWGISDKDVEELGIAERIFKFRRDWQPDPSTRDVKVNA